MWTASTWTHLQIPCEGLRDKRKWWVYEALGLCCAMRHKVLWSRYLVFSACNYEPMPGNLIAKFQNAQFPIIPICFLYFSDERAQNKWHTYPNIIILNMQILIFEYHLTLKRNKNSLRIHWIQGSCGCRESKMKKNVGGKALLSVYI